MKNMKQILNDVLKDIQPDKYYEKEIFSRINYIIKKINQNKKNIKAILGGSGAKGTWLKTFDADIFVLFDYANFKEQSDKLSDTLEKILKKKFRNVARLHGSRDYFQIKQGKFTFEIIPILKIKKAEQAKNITDVSPLHSKWVSKYMPLVNEMKLTKQFCQAQNVYGAESYIRGFSGYICEILTVHYGSFLNLMGNAAKWPEKVVVDVEKYYKGKDVFKIINTSKLVSPLIVIDPVQRNRNAAAALSQEKFEAFKKAAKELLENHSKEFFAKKDMKSLFLSQKTKDKKLVILEASPISGKIDVIGSKFLKIYEFFSGELKKQSFRVISSDWDWDKKHSAYFYFLLGRRALSKMVEIEGPPIKIKIHADNFRKIHKKTFIRSGKIFANEPRHYQKPEDLLKSLAKAQFVREKCKSINLKIL